MALCCGLVILTAVAAATERRVEFSLTDMDGKVHTLSDYQGKWVIVNYWATWCPPCLEEIPDLVDLYEENRDTIVVLGIAFEEVDMTNIKAFYILEGKYIDATRDEIMKKYGSFESYAIKELGLTKKEIFALKNAMLN